MDELDRLRFSLEFPLLAAKLLVDVVGLLNVPLGPTLLPGTDFEAIRPSEISNIFLEQSFYVLKSFAPLDKLSRIDHIL